MAGDHVPEIPLLDVVGNEKEPFIHIGAIWLKIGLRGTLKLTIDAGDVPSHPYVLVTITV